MDIAASGAVTSFKGPNSSKQSETKPETPDVEMIEDFDNGSAPIEMLSEFLSAVMSRDYESALSYCKTILQYEPGNKIVQEFYPLIQERLQQAKEGTLKDGDSDETTGEDEDSNSYSSKSGSTGEFTSGSDLENEDENGNSTSDDCSTDGGGWITALNTDSDSTEKDDNEQDNNSNPTTTTLTTTTLTTACTNQLQSLSL